MKIPRNIKAFNEFMNEYFNYGILVDGKIYEDYTKEVITSYRTLSIKDFQEYKTGICWDFVQYEACWFLKHKLKYKTFYIEIETEDNSNPTHTFLVFFLNDKVYYFESSWYEYKGIEEFDNLEDLLETVCTRHIETYQDSVPVNGNAYIKEIKLPSKKYVGLSFEEYMQKVHDSSGFAYEMLEEYNLN